MPVVILVICGLLGVLGVGGVLLWAGMNADPSPDRAARPPAAAPDYPRSSGSPTETSDFSGLDARLTDNTPCYTSSCLINMELVNNGVRRAAGKGTVRFTATYSPAE